MPARGAERHEVLTCEGCGDERDARNRLRYSGGALDNRSGFVPSPATVSGEVAARGTAGRQPCRPRSMTSPDWIAEASFDTASLGEHPRRVLRLVQRLAALALTLALMAGNAAVCAGWLPTPEARMACCADGGECPMHEGASHRSGSERVLTQLQADSCCASSESQKSSQSSPTFVAAITAAILGAGTVLPANVPALVLSDGWRTSAPIPVAPVPKHVLLSVFLV